MKKCECGLCYPKDGRSVREIKVKKFYKGDRVIRTDTEVYGTVTDSRRHFRHILTKDGRSVREYTIGVQWDSGFGSNFGPQWTPENLIGLA